MNSVESESKNEGIVADANDANAEGLGKGKGPGRETFVDAVFDLGLSWAEFGVSHGKQALTQSAKTLERAAKSLDDLQRRLRKD